MGEGPIEPDYGSDAFTVRREPLQDIIQSLSSLYLDPVLEGEEGEELTVLPPPMLSSDIKGRIKDFETQVLDGFKTQHDQVHHLESQVSALERLHKKLAETILDGTKQECQRVKQLLEQNMQSLGNAVMDCLRRRGKQLKAKVLPSPYAMSTPTVTSASPFDTGQRSIHFSAPIKIEFPKFSSQEGEDPIAYLEKCDEYLAIHPLSSTEILSMLPSVLIHTAKDWWIAERTRVKTWAQFKTLFLRSFLPDDHEVPLKL